MPKRKIFGFLARKPDLSSQEFHDHYRHPHGTMGLSISTLRDYVQSHQVDVELLDESQSRFEIVAELWFDNAEDIRTLRSEPMMKAFHNADEFKFCDMRASKSFIGEEDVVQSGPAFESEDEPQARWRHFRRPTSIKLIQYVLQEAQGELAKDEITSLGERLGAYRQVLWHPAPDGQASLDVRRTEPEFSEVREFWWPTLTELRRSVESDRAAWDMLTRRPTEHSLVAVAEWWR